MRTSVSLVATLKNERASVDGFLRSLAAQCRLPDEVVLVDGGSTDGTFEAIERASRSDPRVRVIQAPGSNIARGRNVGIERAEGPIVAVTDAGTIADPRWLERLVAPLEADPELAVSSGFYVAGGETCFERCLGTIITPQLSEIDPDRFLPSSRSVAMRKEWWQRAGGYPEWLRHCEDLVFNLELERAGARFRFVPEAVVTWRSRPNLLRFSRQYFDYARGDGRADLWGSRHAARYGAYALGSVLAVLGRNRPAARLALATGCAVHFQRFYRRLGGSACLESRAERFAAAALIPLIVVTGDIAKMIGYPVGHLERRRAGSRGASQAEVPDRAEKPGLA